MEHQNIIRDQAAEPFTERGERHVTVLVNAAISQGGRSGLCRIRDVGVDGMGIETSLPLTVGEEAVVTLSSGREAVCIVRWTRDGRAGMSCADDPTGLLIEDRAERMAPRPGPALPRFAPVVPVRIRHLGRAHRCHLDSLSTSDILLCGTPELEEQERLVVEVHGLGAFPAVVCICEGGDLFARFTPPLPFRLMDEWLASVA